MQSPRRSVFRVLATRSTQGETQSLITAEGMRRPVDDDGHRLTFERNVELRLGLINLDLEAAATPLNSERKAAPVRRQFRIEG